MVNLDSILKQSTIKEDNDSSIDYHALYPTPLDLMIAHKKSYMKYNHILKVEQFLLDCWTNKDSGAISIPSRFGKSETTVAWIAWLLIQYPSLKFMIVTYNQKLSKRFNKAVLEMVERFAPDILDRKDTKTTEFFETKEDGYVLTVSPGSTASGYGASIVVIDDLLKSGMESMSETIQATHDEFMDSVISTRIEPFSLDEGLTWYDPFIVGIGTLYSADDWLYSWHDGHKSLKMSALDSNDESIWPERWSSKALLEKKQTMSSYNWQAMYCADPINREGNYLKIDWLREEPLPTKIGEFRETGLFVDPAATVGSKSDSTVAIVARKTFDNRIYIQEMYVYKKTMFDNITFLYNLYQRFKPGIFRVEDVGFATGLVEGLQKLGCPVLGWKPGVRDKTSRIIQQIEAPLESGIVCFHKSVLENETFLTEYERFPAYKHDDTVDCLAIACELMLGRFSGNPYTSAGGPSGYYDFTPGQIKAKAKKGNPYSRSHTSDGKLRKKF